MIAAHNFKQVVFALVSFLVGILGFVLAFYFFRFAFAIVADAFGVKGAAAYSSAFAAVMLLIIGLTGLASTSFSDMRCALTIFPLPAPV